MFPNTPSVAGRLLLSLSALVLSACSQDSSEAPGRGLEPREVGALLTAEEARYRRGVVSEPAYTLAVDLDRGPDSFAGRVDIDFQYGAETRPLTVDFRNGTVLSVEVNGEPVDYRYNGHFITLPMGLMDTGSHRVSIEYLHDYSRDGAGLYRYEDPEDGRVYLYTDFQPYSANRLFPHFDQPDLKGTYTLSVTAPVGWQVVSTTRETDIDVGEEQWTWRFPATLPLSSYIFALHAGEYAVYEDAEFRYPLRLFVRQSMAEYADPEFWFEITRQGFDYFDDYFGLPYPFEKYDQLVVPDFIAGAMENVGAVTFSENKLFRGEATRRERMYIANVIMHEMAHMWFGDITTMAWWNGLWLNESFATYMAENALANATEFKETWHQFFIADKQWAYTEDQLVTTHPIELPVRDTEEATTNFDGITYGKGAAVLKQLGFLLGDDTFRRAVRDYIATNAWGNTELEDFMGAMATAADRKLDYWTQEWLYTAGLNTVEARYECVDGKIASMVLEQSTPPDYPTLREQRTVLALFKLDGERLVLQRQLPLLFGGARTPVPEAEGAACPDFVYPNYGDYAYIKVALDERSLATISEHVMGLEDPLQRNMAWYDLYEMMRDARLDLTDYLDILGDHLASETDLNVLADLLSNLRSGFSYLYQVPSGEQYLAEYAQRFEKLLWQQVAASEGDARQLWLQGYIDSANDKAAWQRLEDLLQGRLVLDGFALDQDQRWRIVMKLSEHLWPGHQALVAAELARDGSSRGKENAVRAEVLSARGESKYQWIARATESGEDYSLRRSRTIVAGLFPSSSQRALAEPYAVELLAQLPRLDREHDTTFHDRVTYHLMPRLCTPENVARLKAAVERYDNLNPAIVQALKIAAQQDERCVAIGERLAREAVASR
ncbi:MAG: aminopeptidase N [Halieaceae bacterium]|jgi:aminopeptidase N|nr:aminopeptidase N [Halieaceae bacterium]